LTDTQFFNAYKYSKYHILSEIIYNRLIRNNMPLKKDKSQIDSFYVSLGPSSPIKPDPKHLEPWNILVCSDLGFVSHRPSQVRIAEWNEFMASQGIVLSGSVSDMLADGGKPVFIEYPVKSMKDFSTESIVDNVPAFAAWSRACFALEQLLDGKTSLRDALSALEKAGLPAGETAKITAMFAPAQASRPRAAARRSSPPRWSPARCCAASRRRQASAASPR
jgi:hypothetical protein